MTAKVEPSKQSLTKKKAWNDPDSKYNSPEYREGQARDKKAWWDSEAGQEAKEKLKERHRLARELKAQKARDVLK